MPYLESRTIADTYPNYIKAMEELDFAEIRRGLTRTQDNKAVPVTAMLYQLLRHSYLYEYVFGAIRLYHLFSGKSSREFRERSSSTSSLPPTTYWDCWRRSRADVRHARRRGGKRFLSCSATRNTCRGLLPQWDDYFGDVDELHRALGQLAKMSTGSLERLFAEHLDLGRYRLDAWITGLVYQRLIAARLTSDDRRMARSIPSTPKRGRAAALRPEPSSGRAYARGLYLGAYGWVEDIQRRSAGVPPDDCPRTEAEERRHGEPRPERLRLHSRPIAQPCQHRRDPAQGERDRAGQTAFNIDLSSRRVRDALWMIDGVRNGQTPAALLGYRFERALRKADRALQKNLPYLRERFPMPRPTPVTAGRIRRTNRSCADVVNGLDIVQAIARRRLSSSWLRPELRCTRNGIAAALDDTWTRAEI